MRLVLCACLWSASAMAGEVGVGLGAVAATRLGSAPAVALGAAVDVGRGFALTGDVGGWTLGPPGGARTELLASVGIRGTFQISTGLHLLVGVGPALALSSVGSGTEWAGGLALTPQLELATRRRTLAFRVGLQGAILTDGARGALVAGAVYAFE